MAYEYINDTFGENVETLPKYKEVEKKAIELLVKISNKKISYDDIYEGFEQVNKTMADLNDNTIGPGYPLWLSKFLAFNYLKWRDWYLLQKMYLEQPEKFSSNKIQAMYREIAMMNHDEAFFSVCRTCAKKLEHKLHKPNKMCKWLKSLMCKLKGCFMK